MESSAGPNPHKSAQTSPHHEGYLVISNISKKQNVKTLITVAVAFGVEHVVIVGQPHFDLATHAPRESVVPRLSEHVKIHRVEDLRACKTFLSERRARLYGIEIVDGARSVEEVDFKGHPCAFMMGNEARNQPTMLSFRSTIRPFEAL